MKRWIGAGLCACLMCPAVFAEGKAKGRGQDSDLPKQVERAGERVAGEVVDAVTDELIGEGSKPSGGMPPGLSKKGKMPPGLEKQGKTPPGWEKASFGSGQPQRKEGLLRRFIRGLFGRSSEPKS